MLSLKRSTAGALAVPCRVLSPKNYDKRHLTINYFFKFRLIKTHNLVLLEGGKNSCHAHKTEFWYLLGVLFKISDELPRPFYMGVPPGGLLFRTVGQIPSPYELISPSNPLPNSVFFFLLLILPEWGMGKCKLKM